MSNTIKITIVNDSTMQATVLADMLSSIRNFEINCVNRGNDLLDLLANGQIPDLILLELVLPDIDGYTLCRKIKFKYNVPIIILSALDNSEDVVKSFSVGADDYIAKPIVKEILVARIKNQLRIRSLQDELVKKNKELEESYENITKLSIIDPLTKVYNRVYFNDIINKKFDEFKRYGIAFSCAIIDIDKFKKVNDEFGYIISDKILVEFTHVVANNLRESDFFARFSGDKFAMIYSNTSGKNTVLAAEKIANAINENEFSYNTKLTVSIGISETSESIKAANDLIYYAEEALIRAKEQGGNIIRV